MPEFGEMHLGEWEGLSMAELEQRDEWRRFNAYRSGVRCPGGELMIETQTRIVGGMDCVRKRHPEQTVAIVSHADPLRAALAFYLGMPLDLLLRFEISPASVSVVQAWDSGTSVICLNETGEIPI
jgi:broad specificity phosphatase PhoE